MRIKHDDDVIGYKAPAKDRAFRTVEFHPEWVDEEGLLSRLGPWIEANVQPGELLVGTRVLSFTTVARFEITGPTRHENGHVTNNWRALFDLQSGNRMEISPGEISVYDHVSHRLIGRYIEHLVVGGTTWKADVELRLVNLRNYHDVPAIMNHTHRHIDAMVHSLTGVKEKNVSGLIQILGSSYPFQDRYACLPTHPLLIRAFEYVRAHYIANPLGSGSKPNEVLFHLLKDACRRICLGENIEPLYPLEIEGSPIVLTNGPAFHGQ